MEIFEDIADKTDHADAWYMIGRVKEFRGDYEGARKAYETAVDKDSDLARLALGQVYQYGYGVDVDYEKAKMLYEEAVSNDCLDAYNGIGDLYQLGYGVEADGQTAVESFLKATEGTDPDWVSYAYMSLGVMYGGNYSGVEGDVELCMQYYRLGAEEGGRSSATCLRTIGDYYLAAEDKENATQYYEQALNWYTEAIREGNADAKAYTGVMYAAGKGTDPDPKRGVALVEEAVDAGFYQRGIYRYIGSFYANGNGVDADYETAFKWFEKAAERNEKASIEWIQWLVDNGHIDAERAAKWLE